MKQVIFKKKEVWKMTKHTVKTEEDILKAFENESRARWTYKAFADKAEQEGNHEVAKLFRAAAASEEIHANSLLKALQEMSRATNELWVSGMYDPKMVKDSTADNLKEAINENIELSKLYPRMIQDAEKDGWSFARECFTYASAVDKVHESLFNNALQNLGKKKSVEYFVCESCGNTIDHKPADSCKVCGSHESAFRLIQ
jgi:rubrerythrin